MNIHDIWAAQKHSTYDDALRQAVKLAAAGTVTTVYWDGSSVFVSETKPVDAVIVCVAQSWNHNTVQLRFPGANSEWVYV